MQEARRLQQFCSKFPAFVERVIRAHSLLGLHFNLKIIKETHLQNMEGRMPQA
jgi:hypothetical protein